jgi:hypothetical protein
MLQTPSPSELLAFPDYKKPSVFALMLVKQQRLPKQHSLWIARRITHSPISAWAMESG